MTWKLLHPVTFAVLATGLTLSEALASWFYRHGGALATPENPA